MAHWTIVRYAPDMEPVWNGFVAQSRNGTFLADRRYMDYHADRFADCSLMACKEGKLKGMLPANITADGWLQSHGGLTYGGWITPAAHFDAADMLELWDAWMEWCVRERIKGVDYKPVPYIYHRLPADEDIYALFRHNAKISECNMSEAILLANPRGFNTRQRRNLRKGIASEAVVEEGVNAAEFHSLLSDCLEERHGVAPVHSAEELQLLQSRFPDRIRIFGTRNRGRLSSGVCMYETSEVAHCQYIASSAEGRENGELTFLFSCLITLYGERGFRYFDFGTCNEDHGKYLNEGLMRQKSELGGSGVAYQRFEITF